MSNQFGNEVGNDPIGIAIALGFIIAFMIGMCVIAWLMRRQGASNSRPKR